MDFALWLFSRHQTRGNRVLFGGLARSLAAWNFFFLRLQDKRSKANSLSSCRRNPEVRGQNRGHLFSFTTMASFRAPALKNFLTRHSLPSRHIQRRWAQVHDVRFLATHQPNNILDRYKDKLSQKAKQYVYIDSQAHHLTSGKFKH